jgi:hypothetical protein
MEILIAFLITIIFGFIAFCIIILNGNKDELWEEIYKKLRR